MLHTKGGLWMCNTHCKVRGTLALRVQNSTWGTGDASTYLAWLGVLWHHPYACTLAWILV